MSRPGKDEARARPVGAGLAGLFGRPYVDLEPVLRGLSGEGGAPWAVDFAAIHDEICVGLASLPLDYTGGSHRSMGIMPPCRRDEAVRDYGEVIRGLDAAGFETFCSLAHDPESLRRIPAQELRIGEERDHALTRRQMLWLKMRHGVYFPWKAYLELMPNRYWDEKADPSGKAFTRNALTFFPKTVAMVRSLPFSSIGRCNVMGLEGGDHGTVHRDGDPADQTQPDQFITFVPANDKQLFLWDDVARRELDVDARVYWFNDFDYHGVRAAPHFRYSIRVDGTFTPEFAAKIAEHCRGSLAQ